MNHIQNKSIKRSTLILFAAITLSMAPVTDALAAGHGGGGGHRFGGGNRGANFQGETTQVPSMPAPIFNPSAPYTVPSTPEVPVSPASPGSIFGNG
jgi:hypothetical protein